MHELFEHTADLGLRARANSLDQLFGEMAAALLQSLLEEPTSVMAREIRHVTIEGNDRDYLLFDWLRTLLQLYESECWLARETRVTVDESGLTAELRGEPLDQERHERTHEVKAITYHELKVEETDSGRLAEAIVDI